MTALDPGTLVAGGIFGAWAIATILSSAGYVRDRVRALDVLGVVPEWRFFGPNPGRSDFHLLYRDGLATGELTGWIEVPLILPRPWHAFAFNPDRRPAKALMDLAVDLSRRAAAGGEPIVASMPYLTFLQLVSARPSTELSTHRQFLVLLASADTDDAEPELLFSSELHELDPPAGP